MGILSPWYTGKQGSEKGFILTSFNPLASELQLQLGAARQFLLRPSVRAVPNNFG